MYYLKLAIMGSAQWQADAAAKEQEASTKALEEAAKMRQVHFLFRGISTASYTSSVRLEMIYDV